jgi:hypothetical protein
MVVRLHLLQSRALRVASVLTLAAASVAAHAVDCEPLSGAVGPAPKGFVTYRLGDLSAVELLARDGSRVPIRRGDQPAPTLTRDGVLPPTHWANAADVAVYNDDHTRVRYLFASGLDGLRLCRIEFGADHGGPIERLAYDDAGRIVGWQKLHYAGRKWQVDQQRCFMYGSSGQLTGYARASASLECANLKSEQVQLSYVHDATGRLTRVIDRDPPARNLEDYGKPRTTVVLFNGQGHASHMIETDSDGDPIQLPVDRTPERSGGDGIAAAYQPGVKIGANVNIVLADPGRSPLPNREWQIVLIKAVVEPYDRPDRVCIREIERVFADGTTDEDGRVQLTAAQKEEIWTLVRAHPNRVCMRAGPDAYILRIPYPKEDWGHCLDARQSEAWACPAH